MKKLNFNVLMFLLLFNFSFSQLSGTLDTSFNITGFKFLSNLNNPDNGFLNKTTLINNDGKIVLAGIFYDYTQNAPINERIKFMVVSLNVDTSFDSTFGNNGVSIVAIPLGIANYSFRQSDFNNIMTFQPDGKIILVSGCIYNLDNYKMLAVRLNIDGTLDTSFGNNGINIIETGFVDSIANTVKVQSDNKIIVAGFCGNTSSVGSMVRLLPNGSMDTTFGINGVTPNINSFPGLIGLHSEFTDIDILPDGKIVGSGRFYSEFNSNWNFFTVKYNSNGTLDSSFGVNGLAMTPATIGDDWAEDQIIQPDGKILAVGRGEGVTLVRLNSNGTLDNSFGPSSDSGVVTNNLNGFNSLGYSAVLQPDNKIVLVGYYLEAIIARLNSDGTVDTTFNNVGYTVSNFGSFIPAGNVVYNSIHLLSDGKFLVSGQTPFALNGLGYYYSTLTKFNSGLNLSQISFNKNDIKFSPNPTQNKVSFDNSSSQFNELEIYNSLGQKIANQKLLFTSNQEIDLSNFSIGIYIVKLFNENKSVTIKIIRE
jgi:uncharacterized delta-60 repeat protein